ncbi:MAG: methyl-accepting chemotaxis protein, partial [Phycisphaerales bacterium]|nr:methyl-accepting chemotaxis protein [Phycisphaerales bacterium]
MKLGHKIGFGFGAVVALTVAVGAVGLVQMRSATRDAEALSNKYVPEADVASDIESALAPMNLNARSFGFTGDAKYLEAARKHAADLKVALGEAAALAGRFPELTKLRDEAATAQAAQATYVGLLDETAAADAAADAARGKMNAAAAALTADLTSVATHQVERMGTDVQAGLDKPALLERRDKIALVAELRA